MGLIAEQPYRFFFPFGIFMGIFGVAHWLLYGLGVTAGYSGMEHASIQIQSFMSCFVAGFLLTAMPKMLLSRSASRLEISYFILLALAMPWLQVLRWWVGVEICFILNLAGLSVFILRRLENRQGPMPAEFIMITFAFANGITGAAAVAAYELHAAPAWAALMGRQMIQLGFMLCVVMGVGGFMAPRLLGFFAADVAAIELDPRKKELRRQKAVEFHILCGAFLFTSFWFEPLGSPMLGAVLRAAVVTAQLIRTTKIYRPLRERNIALFLLWLSLWSIVLGLWGVVIFPAHRIAALHFVFVGGFSLMTFVVATKVIFTHAGAENLFHTRMIPLWILAAATFAALLLRVAADLMPSRFFTLLVFSSSSWIFGALVWLAYVLPKIIHLAGVAGGCPMRRSATASKMVK